jgi:hypothetical protein
LANTNIECIISNPTPRRRVIYSGAGENGGKVIAIDAGQKVRAELADFIFKRMKAVKNDLVVEPAPARGKGETTLFDTGEGKAETPRAQHDMKPSETPAKRKPGRPRKIQAH